jgi:hypothetical protein
MAAQHKAIKKLQAERDELLRIVKEAGALLERTRPDDAEHAHHLHVGCWPCDYECWKAKVLSKEGGPP